MRIVTVLLIFVFVFSMAVCAEKITDDQLFDTVRRKLANDPEVKGGAFQVDVKDGVVTIKGVVEKQKQKERAESLTKKTKGVTGVVNQLEVKPAGIQ